MYSFLLLLLFIVTATAIPANGKSIRYQENSHTSSDAFKNTGAHIKLYEYFDESTITTEDDLTQVTSSFQKFNEFPQKQISDEANIKFMKIQRSDDSNNQRNSNPIKLGFGKRRITYGFQKLTEQLPREVVIREIKRAFDVWAQTGLFRFTELQDADFADITIGFYRGNHLNDGYKFDGVGYVLAHAFKSSPTGDRISGDIHFDDDETWIVQTDIKQEGVDIYSVALHELGHALGATESSVTEAAMYGMYKYLDRNFRLHADDIRVMNQLYDERVPPLPPVESEELEEPEEGLC